LAVIGLPQVCESAVFSSIAIAEAPFGGALLRRLGDEHRTDQIIALYGQERCGQRSGTLRDAITASVTNGADNDLMPVIDSVTISI
jgi:hypothetical protein